MEKTNVYKNIEDFNKKFLQNEDIPYDLVKIMQRKENILVLQYPNNLGISGMTINKQDRLLKYYCIYVNTNDPLGRRNFSFAHELYHVYYEKGKRDYSIKKEFKKDPIEKRAEIFASNIIIPRLQLLRFLKTYGCKKNREITMEKIFDLQLKFNASFQAIIYAIESLKSDERFEKYNRVVPLIPEYFFRFYTMDWDILEEETLRYNPSNYLNTVKSEYIFPEKFEEDLIQNYKNRKINEEDLKIIYNFFEKDIKISMVGENNGHETRDD